MKHLVFNHLLRFDSERGYGLADFALSAMSETKSRVNSDAESTMQVIRHYIHTSILFMQLHTSILFTQLIRRFFEG
jgi:hypothetical protein